MRLSRNILVLLASIAISNQLGGCKSKKDDKNKKNAEGGANVVTFGDAVPDNARDASAEGHKSKTT